MTVRTFIRDASLPPMTDNGEAEIVFVLGESADGKYLQGNVERLSREQMGELLGQIFNWLVEKGRADVP